MKLFKFLFACMLMVVLSLFKTQASPVFAPTNVVLMGEGLYRYDWAQVDDSSYGDEYGPYEGSMVLAFIVQHGVLRYQESCGQISSSTWSDSSNFLATMCHKTNGWGVPGMDPGTSLQVCIVSTNRDASRPWSSDIPAFAYYRNDPSLSCNISSPVNATTCDITGDVNIEHGTILKGKDAEINSATTLLSVSCDAAANGVFMFQEEVNLGDGVISNLKIDEGNNVILEDGPNDFHITSELSISNDATAGSYMGTTVITLEYQ